LAESVSYCLEVVSPDDIDAVQIIHPVEYVSESVFYLEESLVGGSERLPQSVAVVAVEVVELGLDGSYLVVHEVYVRRLTTHLRTYTAGQSVQLVLVVAWNFFFMLLARSKYMGISGVVLLPFLLFPFPLFPFPAPWVCETTVQKKMRDNVMVFMIL
jgi:hypothetical protein